MREEEGPQPGAANPEDAAQYWREQCEWLRTQLSAKDEVAETLACELREALTAVKVLARLVWNSNL